MQRVARHVDGAFGETDCFTADPGHFMDRHDCHAHVGSSEKSEMTSSEGGRRDEGGGRPGGRTYCLLKLSG